MPIERTKQWLSKELLKNAEFVVKQIEEGRHNEEGLTRMACHAYYYSIYHKCRSLMPSSEDSTQRSVHSATRKKLTAKSEGAGVLYENLRIFRIWADYEERKPSFGEEPLDIRAVISIYNQLSKILDELNWE
jgi:uncharacterized protein (UPF0332 family)